MCVCIIMTYLFCVKLLQVIYIKGVMQAKMNIGIPVLSTHDSCAQIEEKKQQSIELPVSVKSHSASFKA